MTPADALERGDGPPTDYERATAIITPEQIAALRAAGFAVVPRLATRSMADAIQAEHGFEPVTDATWKRLIEDESGCLFTWSAMLAVGEVKAP